MFYFKDLLLPLKTGVWHQKKKCNIIIIVYFYVKFHVELSIKTILVNCIKPNDLKYGTVA